jgi:hypothetical protein
VILAPDKNQRNRHQQLHDALGKPEVHLRESEIRPTKDSPYAIELLVKDGKEYRPRKAIDEKGQAFVKIDRDEVYAVRLINDSADEAAVTLAIDGLSMFAFSENRDYEFILVPAGKSAVIAGWHRNNKVSDAFQVTEYAKSAAAQLLTPPAKMGTITATFAAAWPLNSRPPRDEKFAKGDRGDATGRGPEVRQAYEEVERHVGLVRAVISVRYTRPE